MSAANISKGPTRSRATFVGSLCEGWRQAQTILAEMFEVPVAFSEPTISNDLVASFATDEGSSAVGMAFTGDSSGFALFIVSPGTMQPLVAALLGESVTDPDAVLAFFPTTVVELGNVVLNSVVAEVGRTLGESYRFELPVLCSGREVSSHLETAGASVVLVGEATVYREHPSPLGIGLLLDEPLWNDHA